ncbi:MAG: glutamate--tRNA ligase [Candidatus Pacebacteria bacterium]|jgi:glutamyl-tRNA synthetase|nr:glutamate--tRNA ligase [bacterium]MDP6528058.1 glutamate--tRNA ligase [Candidatus Paceibacterota bacterium]MDP6659584.1 glutamate--tRNA ligase [Candidatus Paceibacterota bacterium]|tara:strand:- start:16795 stop:18117 length:1323 start_codon:yes stop_codon:yes gene_type:complete
MSPRNLLNSIFGKKEKVVTRIAASPTGNLHVGTARSALFNYLFARKNKGKFIIRIEDTDESRSEREYEKNILDGLNWLGLESDEVVKQSDLVERHTECIEKLLLEDKAYESLEDGNKVIRLRNNGGEVVFNDLVRGEIKFDVGELGDFIIARSRTSPLYHLAVVVDDADMDVTHVIRGEDHISNTPRQILIQQALGFKRPKYAHIPLILAPDRSKLSKRTGSTSIDEFRKNGYLAGAFLNYLALLGWNPGTDKELFTMDELIREFDLNGIQKGGAIFDEEKLKWFNREHISNLSEEDKLSYFSKSLSGFDKETAIKMIPVVEERFSTTLEVRNAIREDEFSYFSERPAVDETKVSWKKDSFKDTLMHLENVMELLEKVPESDFTEENIKEAIWSYASREGTGSVLWPMRYALTGKEKSPSPFSVAAVLGKEETLSRLRLQ